MGMSSSNKKYEDIIIPENMPQVIRRKFIMKFNDNMKLPAWIKKNETLGVVLNAGENYMVFKDRDKNLYPVAIRDFELFIWNAEENNNPYHCSSTQEDLSKMGLEICFNIENNKAIILRKRGSDTPEGISKIFFVWSTENDDGCNRGLFLEQRGGKYNSVYWVSDWFRTGNEEINRVMLELFGKLLNERNTEKSPKDDHEMSFEALQVKEE